MYTVWYEDFEFSFYNKGVSFYTNKMYVLPAETIEIDVLQG